MRQAGIRSLGPHVGLVAPDGAKRSAWSAAPTRRRPCPRWRAVMGIEHRNRQAGAAGRVGRCGAARHPRSSRMRLQRVCRRYSTTCSVSSRPDLLLRFASAAASDLRRVPRARPGVDRVRLEYPRPMLFPSVYIVFRAFSLDPLLRGAALSGALRIFPCRCRRGGQGGPRLAAEAQAVVTYRVESRTIPSNC